MDHGTEHRQAAIEHGFRRLMATVGVVMMTTPSAELAVQLWYGERPHSFLQAGLFLVGLLTLAHAVTRYSIPLPRINPPDLRLRSTHSPGEPVWSPDSKD